jgi:Ser/Thr protein kinase RdoA (MazF antagonist)
VSLEAILAHWNLVHAKAEEIHQSTWVVDEQYILKSGTNLQWMNTSSELIHALSDQGLPVASIVRTEDGNDFIAIDGTYYMMTSKLEGEHIADIYAKDHKNAAYTLGTITARLHMVFVHIQHTLPCYDNDYNAEISGWVKQTLREHTNNLLPLEQIDSCMLELARIYPALPRQLIHRDLHLENLLFKGDQLTGYIDFDLGQINARIFDICYLTLSFLIGNFENKEKSIQWFEILEQLISGYDSVLPLSQLEKDAIPIMMLTIELLFVAHFTKENDPILAKSAASMFTWLWDNRNSIIV